MTTLREAAQQALEALKDCVKALDALHAPGDSIYTRASDSADRAEIALRAALAQEEQEPVARQERAPFGYIWPTGRHPEFRYTQQMRNGVAGMPLYTAPPRREWRGMTEKEIQSIHDTYHKRMGPQEFARAIEAALKEKNND